VSEHAASGTRVVVGTGPRARGRVRARVVASWREALPFAAIALLALALRLIDLAGKPLHHDESEHAWFAWRLVSGEGYHYDPVFHGPVQFYLIALADLVLGAGDAVTRVPPVLMGTAIVFLPFFLRHQLGRLAALTASLLLCLSPSYLTFSRFAREDIYVACITLGLVIVLMRFLDHPRRWHPPAFLGLLAVSFATKETTYITSFIVCLYLLGVVVAQGIGARRRGSRARDGALLREALALGVDAWAWGAFAFLVTFALLFSTFLTNPAGLQEGLVGSIHYWLSQQPVARGGQPWFYYLVLLPAYEWAALLLGLVGIVVVLRRPTPSRLFLVWMFGMSLAVFSWASERMPWLVIHPLLPLILLAGLGAQELWRARRRWPAALVLGIAALLFAGSAAIGIRTAYFRAADARELLVQVQTSDDVPKVRDRIVSLDAALRRSTGKPLDLAVDSWGGTGWPWSWYLRDHGVGYYDMSSPESVPRAQALLVADPNNAVVAPLLKGYVPTRFRLRVWWVPGFGSATPGDWARWAVRRTAWSPTATMDEWLYLRPDVARLLPEQ
jgi:uncharacterized protein (TIGR03663 family)